VKGSDADMIIRWCRTIDICGWTFFIDRFKTGGWSIGFGRSSWFSDDYIAIAKGKKVTYESRNEKKSH
jgi:hypothetical protein